MSLELILIIILIGGYLAGKLSSRIGLPSVLGMTIFGIVLAIYLGKPGYLPASLGEITPALKSLALVIILLRAGLGIHLNTVKKIGRAAFLLSFVPMLFEAGWISFAAGWLFGWAPAESMLLGFLLAAVSPAVVVPSMLDLKEKGYGKRRDVPTLVLAGASMDDVFAITFFTMVLNGIVSGGASLSAGQAALHAGSEILFALILGVIPGIVVGFFLVWLFRRHHADIRATEKLLLLLGISIGMYSLGQSAHTAALLGVMTVGFILLARQPVAAEELASKLNKAWVFAEIVLFVLIGMAVDVDVALGAGLKGLLLIGSGLIFRSFGVLTSLIGSGLPLKEKGFVVISYLPKATVQAALGAVPLAAGVAGGAQMLAIAVLAILITAPLGLLLIRLLGRHFLELDPGESAVISGRSDSPADPIQS